jgi:hypothetical protein
VAAPVMRCSVTVGGVCGAGYLLARRHGGTAGAKPGYDKRDQCRESAS